MKHLKLFEAYNKEKIIILYEDWGHKYSLGGNEIKSLNLWFNQNSQPSIVEFEQKDFLYFNGLYQDLNNQDIMTYYKVIQPQFLQVLNDDNSIPGKVGYKFTYDSVIDLSPTEFYSQINN